MTDQSNDQAKNAETTKVDHLPFVENLQALGYLQMCADRRFHRIIQQQFKKDVGLSEREDYWIHADAGGTPKMGDQDIAPDYVYYKKGVRMMGWSAHGDGCGGFGEQVPDDEIKKALCKTMQDNIKAYPEATHFIYFATIENHETVIYRTIVEPGHSIECEA